jgi:hypothetical protein
MTFVAVEAVRRRRITTRCIATPIAAQQSRLAIRAIGHGTPVPGHRS